MQVYPNLGMHWAARAKLESYLDCSPDEEMLQHVSKAIASLQCTHAGTQTLQELMRLQYDLRAQLEAGQMHE